MRTAVLHALLAAVLVAVVQLTASTTARPSSPARSACQALLRSLGPDIVALPSAPAYPAGQAGAWNSFNRQQAPACIVYANATAHVAATMAQISQADVPFQVRAGGHSAMTGWNNVQAGVLLALGAMDSIVYDPATKLATVQPGVRWGNAYDYLSTYGVTVAGGRQRDVGTGYLLGGGLSFLSPRAGYGADTIVEAEVVLASGRVVTASATQNADLLRALRGGVNRLGVVTSYTLRTFDVGTPDQKKFIGGAISLSLPYPPPANATADPGVGFLRAFEKFTQGLKDPMAYSIAVIAQSNTPPFTRAASALLIYQPPAAGDDGNSTALPQDTFGPLLSIPGASVFTARMSWSDVSRLFPDGTSEGTGWHYGAAALYPFGQEGGGGDDAPTLYKGWNAFNAQTQNVSINSYFALTPIPTTQIDALYNAPGGPGVIRPPRRNFAAVQLSNEFSANLTSTPPLLLKEFKKLVGRNRNGPGLPLFANECDREQDVFRTYGGYDELRRTYAKYDLARLSVRRQSGPIGP